MLPRTIVFAPGCYYHIYNRGANRSSIFRSDANYRYVISLMQKYRVEVGVSIIAYSLLPNHYHWLVRQDGETPAGKLPQRVFGAYSHAFNIANDRSGTLFEGRYKCISVNSDEYLRELSRYIHANSVLHGIALAPELWPYSNYPEWIGIRQGTLWDRTFFERQFGSPSTYQVWVLDYLSGRAKLPAGLRDYLTNLEAE